MNTAPPAAREEIDNLLRALANSDSKGTNKVDLYKFHQERTEKIRTRLWTTLTWLVGVQGALLGLKEQPLVFTGIDIKDRTVTIAFGYILAFLAVYTILVVTDGTKHIESNWHS